MAHTPGVLAIASSTTAATTAVINRASSRTAGMVVDAG